MFGHLANKFPSVHGDSRLLSGFPFMVHGNTDNNLESPGIWNAKSYYRIIALLITVS
jgi:hypothetical protein